MRKIGFLVITFFFYHGFVFSQNSMSFDELATAFKKANSETAKLQILFSEKPTKYTDRADELLPLYHEGYRLAKKNNDKTNRFKAIHYIALTYLYGKVDESTAFQWLQKALIEAENAQNNLFMAGFITPWESFITTRTTAPKCIKSCTRRLNTLKKPLTPLMAPLFQFHKISKTIKSGMSKSL